jgi:hypothetical protein
MAELWTCQWCGGPLSSEAARWVRGCSVCPRCTDEARRGLAGEPTAAELVLTAGILRAGRGLRRCRELLSRLTARGGELVFRAVARSRPVALTALGASLVCVWLAVLLSFGDTHYWDLSSGFYVHGLRISGRALILLPGAALICGGALLLAWTARPFGVPGSTDHYDRGAYLPRAGNRGGEWDAYPRYRGCDVSGLAAALEDARRAPEKLADRASRGERTALLALAAARNPAAAKLLVEGLDGSLTLDDTGYCLRLWGLYMLRDPRVTGLAQEASRSGTAEVRAYASRLLDRIYFGGAPRTAPRPTGEQTAGEG